MNKKEENTLRKFAAPIGLSVDHNNGVIYGVYQGYHLYLIRANNNSYSFTVNFSLNKAGELPQQDEVKQVVKESKDIIDCVIQGYQVTYTLRGAMTVAKTVDKLEPSLQTITVFLQKMGYQDACALCGKSDSTVALYTVSGAPAILCDDCFKKQQEAVNIQNREQGNVKENVLSGTVGAFLGSLIGAGAIILLGQFGYVAAISGIVMAICAIKGYELLGKKMTTKGILISSVIMLVMVYIGNRIDWSISVANYYTDVDLFYAFRILPDLIREGYLEASQYYGNLAMVYLFTAIGAIPTIIAAVRDSKQTQESYKML